MNVLWFKNNSYFEGHFLLEYARIVEICIEKLALERTAQVHASGKRQNLNFREIPRVLMVNICTILEDFGMAK